MSTPDVVLLRAPDESPDPYLQAFETAGYAALCEPVLRFTFPDQRQLRACLQRGGEYSALVAASPRVGRALHQAFRAEPSLRTQWRGRPAYAVGPKTGRWLRKLGLEVRGDEAGTAAALVERIGTDAPADPLLFLSGNRRRDTLPDGLQAKGIPFEEQVVYETHTRSTLDLPPPSERCWLVVFSPSGLEALTAAEVPVASYRLAAIGPTTAGALRDAGHTVAAVADEPAPDALVRAIRNADGRSPHPASRE